jgi:hypothetical protein
MNNSRKVAGIEFALQKTLYYKWKTKKGGFMKKRLHLTAFVVLSLFLLASCGSSGGGGGEASISYSGNTGQVTLSDSNADEVAMDAYEGIEMGASTGGAMPFSAAAVRTKGTSSREGDIATIVQDILQSGMSSGSYTTAVTQSERQDGACGGYVSYSVTIDNVGNFTGSMTFSNYNECGGVIHGTVSFSGKVDDPINPTTIEQFSMSFGVLTFTSAGESFSMGGRITADAVSPSMSLDLRVRDNITGEMFWINNYTVTVTQGSDLNGSYEDLTVSGRFYHSTHGFVDLSTTLALRYYTFDDNPSQGELRVDGAGATYARLVVLSNTQYQIFAEIDGVPPEDYDSGPQLW